MGGNDYEELASWKLFMPQLMDKFFKLNAYIDGAYARNPADVTLYLHLKSMQLSEWFENRPDPGGPTPD